MTAEQLSILPKPTQTFVSSDDYETPNHVAQYIAGLVSDAKSVLEPACGTGQILQYLQNSLVTGVEINLNRLYRLSTRGLPTYIGTQRSLVHDNFLTWKPVSQFDAVATNPPFSLAMEFLEHSLEVIKRDDASKVVFLLPGDFFQGVGRYKCFKRLDCHISRSHRIVNRVAYLKDGVAIKGRQICDTIFEFRLGQSGGEILVSFEQL